MHMMRKLRLAILGGFMSLLVCLTSLGCDQVGGQAAQDSGLAAAVADSIRTFAGDFARQVLAAFLL